MSHGCIVVSDIMPETYYFKNSPMVIVPDWKNLRAEINMLLSNHKMLMERHRRTLMWWEQKCSVAATVQFILNTIQAHA
jgi:hypothetical protein